MDRYDSEYALIERIRKGEVRLYAFLVDRYKGKGLALALRIVRSRPEAEEVLQDAFVRAFKGLSAFRGESKFGTWFYRILYNLCLTRVRRSGLSPDPVSFTDESAAEEISGGEGGADVLQELNERDIREILQAGLDRLPEKYRTPLTLFYLQELSYEEIALVMRISIGTLKTNLHRGRLRLRTLVQDHLSVEDVNL